MLVVLGDFMLDVERHFHSFRESPECDVPITRQEKPKRRPGGAGAVVEMVLGMGVPCEAVGRNAKAKCVKDRYYLDGAPQWRDDSMEFTLPISDHSARSVVEAIPPEAAFILVSDYGKGAVSEYLWQRLLELEKPLIVDPARGRDLAWYRGAYAIVPNRVEAGVSSISEAITKCWELRETYPRVCLKLDRDGMIASSHEESRHILATHERIVDVTGAGDMVLAAIGVGLVNGLSWYDCCRFANWMAGLKCQQRGATPVNRTVDDFLASGFVRPEPVIEQTSGESFQYMPMFDSSLVTQTDVTGSCLGEVEVVEEENVPVRPLGL